MWTQIKATLIQIQSMSNCRFILISMRIEKIRTEMLERFSLYNLPAWLKTRSDGAHVAVIPSS